MPKNSVQFQKGMSLAEFAQRIGAEGQRHSNSASSARLRGDEAAAAAVVAGHVPAQPGQEQDLGAGALSRARRVLQQRLADEA